MQIHEVGPDMLAQVNVRDSTNVARMWYEYDPACLLNTSALRPLSLARSTKVEHGRIFMLTASGFITSEVMGELPVFMSPWPCMFIDDMPGTTDELSDSPIGYLRVMDFGSLVYPACLCRLAFVIMFFHDGFLQDAFPQWDFSRYPAGYYFADV
jgi:hypothetical protein